MLTISIGIPSGMDGLKVSRSDLIPASMPTFGVACITRVGYATPE